jgi:hypothetical protein
MSLFLVFASLALICYDPPMSFGTRKIEPADIALGPERWYTAARLVREVGAWMARLDLRGGIETEARETAAMPRFLDVAARKFANVEMVAALITGARDMLAVKTPLPETILFERAQDVIDALSRVASPYDVNAYKLLLIEAAEAVARAGREQMGGWFKTAPAVSAVEKEGINRLIYALGAADMIEKWAVGPVELGPGVRVYTSPLKRRK